MFRDLSLGAKIGVGFLSIGLVFVVTVVITYFQVASIEELTSRAIDVRSPTLQASMTV